MQEISGKRSIPIISNLHFKSEKKDTISEIKNLNISYNLK